MMSVLTRFFKPIHEPSDISRMFAGLSPGRRNKLIKALRNLFNFYEARGFDSLYLEMLRKNLPKASLKYDVKVPSEEEIVNSIMLLKGKKPIYHVLFNLILDNGLRVAEAVEFIKLYKDGDIELRGENGFYIAQIGLFRGTKNMFCAFITEYVKNLLDEAERAITYRGARKIKDRVGLKNIVSLKYLRKFTFNKMVELGIPESVADFIQGRAPVKVCAKHYMALEKQAAHYYVRYAEYLKALREKAAC